MKKNVGGIMNGIRGLTVNEKRGISVQGMFGVPCNYRYIFIYQLFGINKTDGQV